MDTDLGKGKTLSSDVIFTFPSWPWTFDIVLRGPGNWSVRKNEGNYIQILISLFESLYLQKHKQM